MGDKGPNLLGVDRAKDIIKELNYNEYLLDFVSNSYAT